MPSQIILKFQNNEDNMRSQNLPKRKPKKLKKKEPKTAAAIPSTNKPQERNKN